MYTLGFGRQIEVMRRAIQLSAVAVAVVGLALWFFGGMQTTTRVVRPPTAVVSLNAPGLAATVEAAPEGGPSTDFRPGLDFLAITCTVAGGLWLLGLRWPAASVPQ